MHAEQSIGSARGIDAGRGEGSKEPDWRNADCAGDGQWLYPAWQFTGDGRVHGVLAPVLKALRGLDRWAAGVWLVSAHPDLDGSSPREALRAGTDADSVARLAQHDKTTLVA